MNYTKITSPQNVGQGKPPNFFTIQHPVQNEIKFDYSWLHICFQSLVCKLNCECHVQSYSFITMC